MASWCSLPYEIKLQIFTAFIETTLSTGRQGYFDSGIGLRSLDQQCEYFSAEVTGILDIVPEMRVQASAIIGKMIERRTCLQEKLDMERDECQASYGQILVPGLIYMEMALKWVAVWTEIKLLQAAGV